VLAMEMQITKKKEVFLKKLRSNFYSIRFYFDTNLLKIKLLERKAERFTRFTK
jgi:hypothetical protein